MTHKRSARASATGVAMKRIRAWPDDLSIDLDFLVQNCSQIRSTDRKNIQVQHLLEPVKGPACAAGRIQILNAMIAIRFDVRDLRCFFPELFNHLDNIDIQLGFGRDGRKVPHRVHRSANRESNTYRILERLDREDLPWKQIVANQTHDLAAGSLRHVEQSAAPCTDRSCTR